MTFSFDSHKLTITCPACRREISETIGKLKTSPKVTCRCGQVIDIDARDLVSGIKKAEKSIADLRATLSRIGKR